MLLDTEINGLSGDTTTYETKYCGGGMRSRKKKSKRKKKIKNSRKRKSKSKTKIYYFL